MKSFMVMVLFVISLAWKAEVSVQSSSSSSSSSSSNSSSSSDSDSDISTSSTPYVSPSTNLTVFEGSNITFTCKIPRKQDIRNVYWFRGLRNISSCGQVGIPKASDKVKRISVSSNGSGECKLSINQVTPIDTSQYYCGSSVIMEDDAREEDSSGSGSGQSFLNDDFDKGLAFLTVLSATLSPPICEVLPSGELNVGDKVSLTCKPPVNSHLSLLAWYDNKTSTSLASHQYTEAGSSYVVNRVLSVADNLESFTCIAAGVEEGRIANMNRPSCSITPLHVKFTVGVTPHTATVLDRAEALFNCVTRTVFPVKSYHWYILQGNKIQHVSSTCGSCRYKLLKGGRILSIPEVNIEEDDGLQVRCSATNSHKEEESSHWGLLTVKRSNDALSSHSHGGANAAGVFTGLIFFIIVAVFAYYIHKKRLLQDRCSSIRRTFSTGGQDASHGIDMGHRDGQHDGCKAESADVVYEAPRDPQAVYEVPKELPVKDKERRANQDKERIVADKYTYDVPKPIKPKDNTYANTNFSL